MNRSAGAGSELAAPPRPTPAVRPAVGYAALFCMLLMAIVVLQLRAHAYQVEFGSDEDSHYVSGLLIHDYLRAGLGRPLAFLRNYAGHYPVVGIGHWGPLFYCVEAVWMLMFGCSRTAVLLLSGSVIAAIATVCYAVAAPRCGRLIAGLLSLACILSPLAQESSGELMLDGAVALALLIATLAYARFLSAPTARNALWFGLCAVAALLIKGNSLALGLMPPLAIAIDRRFSLLRRPSFWLPLPIVALLAGPWYVLTLNLVMPGFRFAWGLQYTELAIATNAAILLSALGPLLVVAGAAGLVAVLTRPRHAAADNAMTCMAALLAAVMIFQCIVPAAIQDRYMLPAMPPLLLLAGPPLRRIADWLHARLAPRRSQAIPDLLLAAACLSALLPTAMPTQRKPQLGLIAAAPQAWANLPANNPAVLIVAGAGVEPSAVAELALNDPHRPHMFAVRGSRLLGAGGYNNSDYEPRFDTPAQVMQAIDDYRIPLVLFLSSGDPTEWRHVRQVAAAAADYPDRWQPIWRTRADGRQVILYRIAGNAAQPAPLRRLTELSAPHALGGHGP